MKIVPSIQDNIKGLAAGAAAFGTVSYGFNSIANNVIANDSLSFLFGLVAGAISSAWVLQKHRYGEAYLREEKRKSMGLPPAKRLNGR